MQVEKIIKDLLNEYSSPASFQRSRGIMGLCEKNPKETEELILLLIFAIVLIIIYIVTSMWVKARKQREERGSVQDEQHAHVRMSSLNTVDD